MEHEERVLLGHLAEVRAAQLALAVVVSQVEIVEELDDGPAHMMLGVVLRVHMMLGVVLQQIVAARSVVQRWRLTLGMGSVRSSEWQK